MSLQFSNECWFEVFCFIPRTILGCQVAIIAKLFNFIANMRIMGTESERTINEFIIFEDGILINVGNRLFRPMPMPETVPPWNIHIRSIAVYSALGPMAAKFLQLVTSIRPCTLQLDGAHFVQQFDAARAWPNNVKKLYLAKRGGEEYSPAEENGRSLFHIFTDEYCLFRLLETTLLECDLSEMDYNMDLLNWLNHSSSSSSSRRRNERILLLNGDEANIESFLRDIRKNFEISMEPAQYKVRISPEIEVHANWTDTNWQTREKLIFRKVRNGANVKTSQKYAYELERKCINFEWQIDEVETGEEEEEEPEDDEYEYAGEGASKSANGRKKILHISFN